MMNEAQFHCGRATRLSGIFLTAALLSACAEGPDLAFLQPKGEPEASTASVASGDTRTLEERDVESPDVFQSEEAGLWDGRPSLGGVWVAHPDVTEPERVVIRNNANGKEVIGALFRRERDIPGPRLQASSDAAVALGMLAGAPVELNVVALRKQTVEPTVVQEPEASPESEIAAAVPEAETVAETTLDPIAGAAAAIEASETVTASDATEIPKATEVDAAVAAATTTAAEQPKRQGWLAGLFAGNRDKSVGEPLTALKPEDQRLASAEPVVATDAAPAPRPQPRASRLDKPYIQIGIFSVEGNAERAANQMRSAGMVPTVYAQNSGGKDFWRVVVGPAQTKSERSGLIKQIQGVGFSDAYAVTN